jgi:hypothetical protein
MECLVSWVSWNFVFNNNNNNNKLPFLRRGFRSWPFEVFSFLFLFPFSWVNIVFTGARRVPDLAVKNRRLNQGKTKDRR